jgi:release factor glutamine methyltransferase
VADPKSGSPLYRALLSRLSASLVAQPDKPDESPESTLRALWSAAAGTPLSARTAVPAVLSELDDGGVAALHALVERRLAGTPLAYLTARQHFLGIDLLCGTGALIPRAETELLGGAVLEEARALAQARGTITMLDVCTGAGNLAVAVAVHEPRAVVFASDVAPAAVALARANARHLGVSERVRVTESDLFEGFRSPASAQAFDLVTCNPPYVSTAKLDAMGAEISAHEPRLAFDGGVFGVSVLTRLIREAPDFLRPGSALGFEVGLGQGKAIARMLERNPAYRDVRPLADASGAIRAFLART